MNSKFKKVIVDYLLKDLMLVEIIYYKDSIWFINREYKYWYFEYHKKDKHLWWKWSYFQSALKIFSLNGEEHQSIFGELVNMILNKKQILETKYPDRIFKTVGSVLNFKEEVEEVLNCEIKTTVARISNRFELVEEVLNCEVKTTEPSHRYCHGEVEEVFNCKVKTTQTSLQPRQSLVEEVLNHNDDYVTEKIRNHTINTYGHNIFMFDFLVQDVLDIGSNSINFDTTSQQGRVDGVLKNS